MYKNMAERNTIQQYQLNNLTPLRVRNFVIAMNCLDALAENYYGDEDFHLYIQHMIETAQMPERPQRNQSEKATIFESARKLCIDEITVTQLPREVMPPYEVGKLMMPVGITGTLWDNEEEMISNMILALKGSHMTCWLPELINQTDAAHSLDQHIKNSPNKSDILKYLSANEKFYSQFIIEQPFMDIDRYSARSGMPAPISMLHYPTEINVHNYVTINHQEKYAPIVQKVAECLNDGDPRPVNDLVNQIAAELNNKNEVIGTKETTPVVTPEPGMS